jgi:hypothetical protein
MPGITHVALQHNKRPAFALFSANFIRQQAEYHSEGLGFCCPVFVRGFRASALCSFLKKNTNIRYLFLWRLSIPIF